MTETSIPRDAIPYEPYGQAWQGQDNIMSMRWENKELIEQLWLNLAYRTPKTINGKTYLVQEEGTNPPINAEGARAIINMIRSVVNPVASLSKIHQDQALIILKHIKQRVRRNVVMKRKEFELKNRSDIGTVFQIVENVCFMQLMRAVEGHESNQSRTNLVEKRGEESYKMESRGGGGINLPWGGNK